MANTYKILAQEIWLVERTYKCLLIDAVNAEKDIAPIQEIEAAHVLRTKLKNSFQNYPNGFEVDWSKFPESGIFKIRKVQLVSTTSYSINDNAEDATYCYEEAYESTEPGDCEVLESRFIDEENYYSKGYEIYSVDLA